MGRHWKALCAATGLWTVALMFAICGTVMNEIRVLAWAVLVGLLAALVSAWPLALYAARSAVSEERVRLEQLAAIMAEMAANSQVSKIK